MPMYCGIIIILMKNYLLAQQVNLYRLYYRDISYQII